MSISISYEEAQSLTCDLEQAINNGNEIEAVKIAEKMASYLVNIEILVYDTPEAQTINNMPHCNPQNFPGVGNQPTMPPLNQNNIVNLPPGQAMLYNQGYQQNFNPPPANMPIQGTMSRQVLPQQGMPAPNANYGNFSAGPVVYGNLPQHFKQG